MKKLLAVILVAAVCAPAMAATVVSAVGGEGTATITVSVSDDDVLRGVALTVAQKADDTGDMQLVAGTDVVAADFNAYIDYAMTYASGYAVGAGHPAAKFDAAGAVDDPDDNQLPASAFAICAGFLDETENQGGLGVGTYDITIAFDGSADTVFEMT